MDRRDCIRLVTVPLTMAGLPGVLRAAGKTRTRDFGVGDFEAVVVDLPAEVSIESGDGPAVTVTAEPAVLEQVSVRSDGGTLTVSARGSFQTQEPIRVRIVSGPLRAVQALGSSFVTLNGAAQETFEGHAGGSAELVLNDLNLSALSVDLEGSASATASGRTGQLTVRQAGASLLEARELQADQANAVLSGSSEATVSVGRSLEVSVDGAAMLSYTGDPQVRSQIRGAASVEPL